MNLMQRSPLRYPGGKAKLVRFFRNFMKANDLLNKTYIEPYAGGAGVALGLLMNDFVSDIVINDLDISIYAFWHSILRENERFCETIEKIDVSVDEWKKQKTVQENKYNASLFELGVSTFFLNRTNRSGILKAGMIGGWNQNGNYLIDCRFNKIELLSRIRDISKFADRIKLLNKKAEDLITEEIAAYHGKDAFVYFDPPYCEKGSQLYVNFYNNEDHIALEKLIAEYVTIPWIITYDNVDFISNLYDQYRHDTFRLTYTAARKREASEIMIYSHGSVSGITQATAV